MSRIQTLRGVRLPSIFSRHCRRVNSGDFLRRIWSSKDGTLQVQHSHCLLGNGALPDTWLLLSNDEDGWRIVARHRRPGAAFAQAARLARERAGVTHICQRGQQSSRYTPRRIFAGRRPAGSSKP